MRSFLLCLLLLLPAPAVRAWSEFGHRLVAELAYRQLSPSARAAVDDLLRDEPEPTLAGIAGWADLVRDLTAYEHTRAWHYVHIGDAGCVFERARDCRGEDCVVAAIQRYAAVLADPARTRAERVEALKFVVHFVGDVHQPLHANNRDDRGGNEFQVNLRGEGTNLHAVWDFHVLRAANLDFEGWIARLQSLPPPTPGASPAQWAEASCRLANAPGFYPARPGKMSPAYLQAHGDVAAQRLREAGAGLAALLESALGR
jgi:hypothetical protein